VRPYRPAEDALRLAADAAESLNSVSGILVPMSASLAVSAVEAAYPDQSWPSRKVQRATEEAAQADILRELLAPVAVCRLTLDCLTTTATTLAHSIYTNRCFEQLPILADALEDAGCTNTDILTHCRGRGPHVPGCWVIDLILGKE
jgi:hypothetical protein